MKRIFSKKSGFTLVEIVVAFAVFAIMSAMILSMVKLTVSAQRDNKDFADSLEEQADYLAYHYISDEEKFDPDNTTPDGKFELEFYDDNNDSVCDISMDYAERSSVLVDEDGNANTNSGAGVNYFVGNVDYANPNSIQNNGQNQGDTITGLGNSQAARYDTRLTGSKNLDYITIWKVVKDNTYEGAGARYLFETSANGNDVSGDVETDDMPYLQYKLRFCMDTYKELEGVGADGNTYLYKVYDDAVITDCGYIEDFSGDLAWSDSSCYNYRRTTMIDNNKYNVQPTGKNTVRIGVQPGSTDGFGHATTTRFYVVFAQDPKLDLYSFGENYTMYNGKPQYTVYPIKDEDGNETGEHNPNIYGAFTYEKTEKTGT